jgi:hypothetical protein
MEEPATATVLNPGWRKSSYSNGAGANCVETAPAVGAVLVRDTKDNGAGPVLRVTRNDWDRFTATLRADTTLS